MNMMHPYKKRYPHTDPTVFLAPGVQLIGDVTIGEQASIWYNAVLRGDLAPIRIGRRTNF
jgi:carbonic anhydrase/acetyltransferase-like protein (isoleucine patch superfamily)